MVRKVGNRVAALKRTRMATLALGNLAEGQWRHLTAREVAGLIQALPGQLRDKPFF